MLQALELNSSRWFSLEDFKGEVWVKAILGGHEYHVSNYGRVKEPGYVQVRKGSCVGEYHKKPFIKVSKDNGHGYFTIVAHGHHYYVHRIVAECFIPNMFNLPEIDHINGNKSDNRVENLRWVDRTMNMANPLTRAKNRQNADLQYVPIVQLDAVTGRFVKKWNGIAEAARGLGIERANISSMVRGVGGKTLKGFRFIYLSEYDLQKNYAVKYKRGTYIGTDIISDRWVVVADTTSIIRVYPNTQEAAKDFNCTHSAISRRCRLPNGVIVQKRITGISDYVFRYFKDLTTSEQDFVKQNLPRLKTNLII